METKAEQFYPTYKSSERDVLLLEFEEAQKIANSQNQLYGQVTNILIAIATLIFSLVINDKDNFAQRTLKIHPYLILSVLSIFGYVLLRYFIDLQKQITINARKTVTLRTMLGLDYGHIHLTLPNWRVEGATNPFTIKYFNGWFKFKSTPFWIISITICSVIYLQLDGIGINLTGSELFPIIISWYYPCALVFMFYAFIFRWILLDRHETIYLLLVKWLACILHIKLLDNFEYILYRSKLSYLELDRLKVDYKALKTVLVEIEDRNYYAHNGFYIKSLIRGTLSRFQFFRAKFNYIESGASTIPMQLARSLFIPSNQNKYTRKIIEVFLSLWISKQFDKKEQLMLYIASVRYERNVFGLSNAIKHFFGGLREHTLTNEEAFFLVERLSNVKSLVIQRRINHLLDQTTLQIDKDKLMRIYEEQILMEKLKR